MTTNNSLATDRFASSLDAADFSTANRSALDTAVMVPRSTSSYAIATAGNLVDNAGSNFAGDLGNPFDDARIYVNGTVTLNGVPTFSSFGNALTLGPNGVLQNIASQVESQLKTERLAQVIPVGIPAYQVPILGGSERVIDVSQLPLNSEADVNQIFGSGLPSIVRFTGGGLVLPDEADLRNVTIIVENGDLNFNGDGHLLENVTLIVKCGSVNLGNVVTDNTSVYASGAIRMNEGARFGGKNLLATEQGDVIFNGATATIDLQDYIKVIAHGDIIFNASADTRGDFWTSEDFFANQASTLVGKIRATQSVTLNAPVKVVSDWFPPSLEAGVFTVGETGEVKVDWLFDGSARNGQLAVISFQGMEGLEPGSRLFLQEAARRALSNSELGRIVINDLTTGARFNGVLGTSDQVNHNSGDYLGLQSFKMNPGDRVIMMLVPNGTVQEVLDNPALEGDKRPLFSIASANPNGAYQIAQRSKVVGNSTTFVMEDGRADAGSDRDYNRPLA